eukprot:RCo030642
MKPLNISVILWWCLVAAVAGAALPVVFRAGFVFDTSTTDMGWTWKHYQGVVQMHTNLQVMFPSLRVVTAHKENVPDPGPCDPIFSTWASQGFDLVVGCSWG